jgi:peptide-methionine (S)-S-oxide reductase
MFSAGNARLLRNVALMLVPLIGAFWVSRGLSAEPATALPPAALDSPTTSDKLETAVVAGGCFWGVQAVFQHVKGVKQALSGYSGGKKPASYEEVSMGTTGHAESVQIKFDPKVISYGEILRVYFSVAHDPTQLNRQGPDVGPQYRSAIFYRNDAQRRVAEAYIAQLNQAGVFKRPIVTRLDSFLAFYPAEKYHQDYLILHPNNPYIVYNDLPKVENLKRLLPSLYREEPMTVAASADAS